MRIYLHELSEEPTELSFTEKDAWVAQAVTETEESKLLPTPAYLIDMELRKSQDIVFLKGSMKLKLGLLCSRCANDFTYPLESRFQCLFTQDEELENTDKSSGTAHSEPTGANPEDLDIAFLEKDYIELSDVLKEQIYLKIPIQPLCQEDCKGVCPVCGQDKNEHPCQCHRIKNTALANALKNFKV